MTVPSGKRILYIEDEPILCELFRVSVEAHGYTVDTACNGSDGIALFETNPYDAVALDYQLPDMTGLDIARIFVAKAPDLPVLIITGKGSELIAVEAMKLGISTYVTKADERVYIDIIPQTLAQLIERAAERQRQIEAERALHESEKRFRDFAESSSDWFWEMGPDLKFTYLSKNVETLYGIPVEFHIGKTREELAGDDTKLPHWQDHLDILKRREPFRDFQYLRRGPDGALVNLSISGTPIWGDDKAFRGYRGTGTNKSEIIAAERSLVEKDMLLRAAIESVDGGIAIYDTDDRLVLHNTKYKTYLREIADQVVPGVRFEDLVTSLAKSDFYEGSAETIDEWVSSRVKLFNRGVQAAPQKDRCGNWQQSNFSKLNGGGTFLLSLNVTDTMEAVIAREKSERRFRGLFENSDVSIWNENLSKVIEEMDRYRDEGIKDIRQYLIENQQAAWDLVSKVKVIDVNEATLKLFGAKSEEEFLQQIDKTFGDNALHAFIELLAAVWEKRSVCRAEAKFLTLDGAEFDAIVSLRIPTNVSDFASVPVSIFDISEQKRAERKMRESEGRFRDFAESSSDWFWETDDEFRYSYISQGRRYLSGFDPVANIGKRRDEVADEPVDTEKWRKHFEDQENRLPIRDFVFNLKTPDEQSTTISVNGVPVFDDDGTFLGYRGTGTDITDQKITENALISAKEEAEKANAAKSEFLASMSHELRTPLNAVLGFAQMMQYDPKTSLSPSQNQNIEHIMEGGEHLLELVNDVLDLAKIEADHLNLSVEEIDANMVVEECVNMSAPLGKNRDITIINKFRGTSPTLLRTDHMRFKQVLINLLSNAVKYNRDGGTVIVDGHHTKSGFLHLSVADTGHGMNADKQHNIFEMYERLGQDASKAKDGAGIGLTITKLLVEKLAGRIGFDSEVGVGSTFWVEFPLVSNDDVLIWTDALRTGVEQIDKDHQVLVSLVNGLFEDDGTNADKLIDELIDYTGYHFKREEAIMKACTYADMEAHIVQHRKLKERAVDLQNAWHSARDPKALLHIRKFLRGWLFDHIINSDTKMNDCAKGREHDIQIALAHVG
jgi:hemerythrin-like metal-binding protein/PAS domain S-box-containing protein